jgi:hypothetical protein
MKVHFTIRIEHELYERESRLTVPPPMDAQVLVAGEDSGWSETVKRVWFDVITGKISVELDDVVDSQGEGLALTLVDAGWRLVGVGWRRVGG